MSLPSPLPDNPTRWEGWRGYNSPDLYERLGLSFADNPSGEQIEENCRQLLIWWQKKLPLKNQPSNPLSQMLRSGIDEAPRYLVEARSGLLNGETRRRIDEELHGRARETAFSELSKFLNFAVGHGVLTREDENNLYHIGAASGLQVEEMKAFVEAELQSRGIGRQKKVEPAAAPAPEVARRGRARSDGSPADEFRRLLRLSKLSEDDMTDDQRDALCNMGESLGLTGGQAEDLIDEFLEEESGLPPAPPMPVMKAAPAKAPVPAPVKEPAPPRSPAVNVSPLARAQERADHPNFENAAGGEMLLTPSGVFDMGSTAPEAAPNEQPITRVTLGCFYISRFPVTNAEYEKFDPAHKSRRMPGAGDLHPVVYVSSLDAVKFCEWLSARGRRKFRLPTEAEWEYAARGMDGRSFPWGEKLNRGDFANFADSNTGFAWRDPNIDDGYPESSPVGAYPRGVSPCGAEDMAGNVWEWCLDFFADYKGRESTNPRGPTQGARRIYRGGSWKSRSSSLRASARGFNVPTYSSNDVGFRIVAET